VFLTGASSGIGEALALALAERGAVLGLVARRREELAHLARRCEEKGAAAFYYPCDVTDAKSLQEAADSMRAEFERIDILIANAGVSGVVSRDAVSTTRHHPAAEAARLLRQGGESGRQPALDKQGSYERANADTDVRVAHLEPELVRRVIDTNLLGAVNAVYAVLPAMLEQGHGQLVAVSSLAGFRGLPKSAAYSASKAGMTAFFESVRLDTRGKGIDVTIIQPGFIETPLTSGRTNKMPFLMKLDDALPHFLRAIEKRKKFAAFPWQLATIVRAGKVFPAWLYDRIAGRARYRE